MFLLPTSYVGFAFVITFASLSIWVLTMVREEDRRRRAISKIPGPPSPSWLFGNLLQIQIPKEFGEFDGVWCKAYGPVYRFKASFGRDRLMVSDTAAVRFIYNSDDLENGPAFQAFITWLFSEAGISTRKGQDHHQLRAALNVGFTLRAVRNYQPILERVAQRICEKLEAMTSSSESTVVDMVPLLNAATLSAISEGASSILAKQSRRNHRAAALGCPVEELSADLVRTNTEVLELSSTLAPGQVLVDEILNLNIFPRWLLRQVVRLPGKAFKLLRDQVRFTENDGRRLVQKKLDLARKGAINVDEASDVYTRVLHDSILGTATKAQIGLEDLVRQTSTMMIAGQDTTASTLTFLLVELSRRQPFQDSLRKEIIDLSARGLSYDQYPQLSALIKETLRMYPIVPIAYRIAKKDTVIPLSDSITTTDGQLIDRIPICKGQQVTLSVASYQRLESRWGADANTFDPSRWIEGRVLQGDAIGPYANLLAFSSGPHSCLGWRFAILEMQVIICELIRNFAFSVAVDEVIVPLYATVLMPADANGRKRAALVVKKLV
ncbi:cytochrome P450 [Mycena amicta]|nr:cytochrome P450 [Mycena amicta]